MLPNHSPHAVLILQERVIVHASASAARITGRELNELVGMGLEQLLSQHLPDDRERIERLFRWAEKGEQAGQHCGLRLTTRDGAINWIDLLLTPTIFRSAPAVQMIWIDNTPRLQVEARLSENIWRLQILQDINRAMLTVQDDMQTAEAALRHISYLANDYHSSMVHLLDEAGDTAHLVACDSPFSDLREPIRWEQLAEFPENLGQGLPQVISDLEEIEPRSPVLERLFRLGVRSCLVIPMCWDDKLHGLLSVHSALPGEFSFERVQAAQEIANLLAVAFKHTQLKQAETDQYLAAEAALQVFSMAFLSGDALQVHQAILDSLRLLAPCEWRWFFQLQPDGRFVVPALPQSPTSIGGISFPQDDPLIHNLMLSPQPLIIADLQREPAYQSWLGLEPLRSWLGVPVQTIDQISGVIALASSKTDAFTQSDADQLQRFADQIAPVVLRIFQ